MRLRTTSWGPVVYGLAKYRSKQTGNENHVRLLRLTILIFTLDVSGRVIAREIYPVSRLKKLYSTGAPVEMYWIFVRNWEL